MNIISGVFDGISTICGVTLDMFLGERKFDYLFKMIKLQNSDGHRPILRKTIDGNGYTAHLFTIPIGLSINDFKKNQYEISQYLHKDKDDVTIELVNNQVLITIREEIGDISFDYEDYKFEDEMRVPIGIDLLTHRVVYWEFLNAPHLLITGSSGGGKSVMLGVVLSYIFKHIPAAEIYAQDTKWLDMFSFKDCKQMKYYGENKEGIEEILEYLIDVMNERYNKIRSKHCRDVSSYNKKYKNDKIEPIFLVIEEISSFDTNNKEDKMFFEMITKLINKGRGCFIEVILTTQTPYVNCVPGTLKNSIGTTIGLRCNTTQASLSSCGDALILTKLRGKGHGILFSLGNDTEFQGFNIQDDTIERIAKEVK